MIELLIYTVMGVFSGFTLRRWVRSHLLVLAQQRVGRLTAPRWVPLLPALVEGVEEGAEPTFRDPHRGLTWGTFQAAWRLIESAAAADRTIAYALYFLCDAMEVDTCCAIPKGDLDELDSFTPIDFGIPADDGTRIWVRWSAAEGVDQDDVDEVLEMFAVAVLRSAAA